MGYWHDPVTLRTFSVGIKNNQDMRRLGSRGWGPKAASWEITDEGGAAMMERDKENLTRVTTSSAATERESATTDVHFRESK